MHLDVKAEAERAAGGNVDILVVEVVDISWNSPLAAIPLT